MPVILQTFAVTVTLRKLVNRTNSAAGAAAASQKSIDLTRYISENDSIRTVKSLSQSGGGFTISIADQLSAEIQDTIYALVEPMDMIEIRAAREPQAYAGQNLPLIMRGYVSAVQRSESIGGDGTPQRQVVVRGIDGGKFWQIHQVLYQFLQASSSDFLAPFDMLASLGLDGDLEPVGAYMQKLVTYINSKVQALAGFSNQVIPPFTLRCTVTEGQAWMQAVAEKQGSLWTYAEQFADRPWNELFLIDQEAGPVLVFRPVPYRDLSGSLIMPGAADPGTVTLDQVEVLSLDVNRSDARVANYFWVPPGSGTPDTGSFLTAAALANASVQQLKYSNNTPTLYGEKIMQNETHLYSSGAPGQIPTMLPQDQQQSANGDYLAWNIQRTEQLQAMNRDNSLLEEGSAALNGRETLVIGTYLAITRGKLTASFYMNQVAHTISPFHSWTTTVGLERGMGFYDRNKAGNIPFFAEGRPGPYTPLPAAPTPSLLAPPASNSPVVTDAPASATGTALA